MQTKIGDNLLGVGIYLLALVVGAFLVYWGWQPSTRNGAALIIVGIVLVAYAGYRFYNTFLQD